MKRISFALAFVCFLVASASGIAQEEAKDKMMKPTYVMYYGETVCPSKLMEYEEGTRQWIAAIKEAGIDLQFYADNRLNHYGYIIVFHDFAKMNELAMKWSKAVALLRESEWGQARQSAIQTSKYEIWMHDPSLSYWPEDAEMPSPKTPFMEIFTAKTSHAQETGFRKSLVAWKESEVTKEWSKGYDVYRNIIGVEGPVYIVISYGASPAEYFTHGQKVWEANKEKLMEMRMEIGKYMTGMDEEYYWMRPDLSLVSEK